MTHHLPTKLRTGKFSSMWERASKTLKFNVLSWNLTGFLYLNHTHISGDCRTFCQFVPHFITNKRTHPFGISNQNISAIWIPRSSYNSHNFRFYFQYTDDSISKCLFETAHSASNSTEVDTLKFRFVQYDTFYNGQIQQDSTECFMVLIEIIDKGSIPYFGSNNNSTGGSLFDILVTFKLEKYNACDVYGLRFHAFESSCVLYITPTYISSIQELITQWVQQKIQKSCLRCKKNTWHIESNFILQSPNHLIVIFNRIRYINNNVTKDRCFIPIDMTIVLGLHKFSLHGTIDLHGPSISGADNCICQKNRSNYDTSNRFGTNTLFKKKNAGNAKFQYGRHFPRWPP